MIHVNRTSARSSTTLTSSGLLASLALLLSACGGAAANERPASAANEPGRVSTREVLSPTPQGATLQQAPLEPVPIPTATKEVSLGGMLAYADRHSPILSVARSTRSRAEAARAAAGVLLPANPEVSFGAGPRMTSAGTGVDVEVGLTQQISISGQRGRRQEAAERLSELTDAEIEQIRWTVHCDVHAAFHGALVQQERARLAQRVVSFQTEVLRVVERQIAAGETAPLTLRLAQAEVAQARQVLVATEQAFLVSRLRLAQLSGWPAATPPKPAGVVDDPRDPPSLEQLSQVARARLPGIRVGGARVREAQAREVLAGRQGWPNPSIGAQYRREGNPGNEGSTDIVMGVVSLPIPAFERNQGERAKARADVQVAEAELAATRTLLDGQLAEARSEVAAAAARTKAYGTEILPRFEENLLLLKRSFELGEIDILALSAGRERFLRIQSDALSAHEDYFVALAGLERVVGVDLWLDDHEGDHEESDR
jgi:cobalt-zinc-cadmium efflux system outer membrane protein